MQVQKLKSIRKLTEGSFLLGHYLVGELFHLVLFQTASAAPQWRQHSFTLVKQLTGYLQLILDQKDLATARKLMVAQHWPTSREVHLSSSRTQEVRETPTRSHWTDSGAIFPCQLISFTVAWNSAVASECSNVLGLDNLIRGHFLHRQGKLLRQHLFCLNGLFHYF